MVPCHTEGCGGIRIFEEPTSPASANSGSMCRVGLGCASAWGQPWFSEREALAIVRQALELGVRAFDTGPSYSGGYAEPRLGRALRGFQGDDLLVSTKVGTHNGRFGKLFHDLSESAVLRSVEASRQRLEFDCIPLLYLHGPSTDELTPQLADLLEGLRLRGWVSEFGVNSFDPEVIQKAATMPVFSTFMVDYNLLRIEREPLLSALRRGGRRVVSGSALANHLYAPRFMVPRRLQDVWYALRALRNYRRDWLRARRFRFLDTVTGWTPAQLALAFVLQNQDVDLAMFGTTRMAHLEENLRAVGLSPPADVVLRLRLL